MKPTLCLFAVVAFAAAQAGAAIESVRLEPDSALPYLPASLQMNAFTGGRVVIAIDVSAEGKPTDWLVLGYTHEQLVRPCVEALQKWHFSPARLDGAPVPAQVEFTINFSVDGIVISSNMLDEMFIRTLSHDGDRFVYRTRFAGEIDRLPSRLAGPAPKYATEALRQGVRGKVQVRFYIDETGAVRMPSVDAESHPYLAHQAIEAVRDWKFEPPVSKGRPVLVAASEEFDFGRTN
jgi:TonB family protein